MSINLVLMFHLDMCVIIHGYLRKMCWTAIF